MRSNFQFCFFVIFDLFYGCCHTKNIEKGEKYGEFTLKYLEITKCDKKSGPQKSTEYEFFVDKNADNHHVIRFNLNVLRNIGPLKGREKIFRKVGTKFSQILAIEQSNLCQFNFPLKFLPINLTFTNNCVAVKKEYLNVSMDGDTTVRGIVGKKFFFGTYRFIVEFFTVKESAICVDASVDIAKLS